MTEDEAREQVRSLVGDQATTRLERLVALIVDENERQNLIARSTVATMWQRHVLDSVQLLQWAGTDAGLWLDIGTGGGFPGLAIGVVWPGPMMLVEPRRKRAEFLRHAAQQTGLNSVEIRQQQVESVDKARASIISARAVAPVSKLISSAIHCGTLETRWILPRGLGYAADMADAMTKWHGMFHVEHSLSDPQAGIVVATGIAPR